MADKILELFDRDIHRRIEEVVKVDQTDVDVVRDEVEEYVPTQAIKKHFADFLEAYRETPNKPHEGIGVWVSGFFGAGKSSFAKILGYVLEDRDLGDRSATELFSKRVGDPEIQALLSSITEQIPTRSVILDVSTDAIVTDSSEKLTDILYRVLLRELGYSTDRQLAELEVELEEDGRLEAFEDAVVKVYEKPWGQLKELSATARNVASRALHELDPDKYESADSWQPGDVPVSANFVAERCHELMQRRGDGRALVFVVDEVGQYVARSTERMLDLQGLVQALGKVGRNNAAEWKGQVWLVVTSQERLSEVVDNLMGKQVELARLRDRFSLEIDLEPSDIREVTAERVLKKKPSANEELKTLFAGHQDKLAEAIKLKGRYEGTGVTEKSFVELYPFLPYQIPLLIDVVSGLRTQSGASRQVGGSNRTIIKMAQQVIIHEATDLGSQPVGRLVSLDLAYDLWKGLVASERQRDVHEIVERFGVDSMEVRVGKALALLYFVQEFPRTPGNLAAVLHPSVDSTPIRREVEDAIQALVDASKIRLTDKGWELLSQTGKSWEEERAGLEVYPRDQTGHLRSAAERLFGSVSGYRFKNLKTVTVAPTIDGQPVGRGSADVPLHVTLVPDSSAVESAKDRARQRSNTDQHANSLHWVVPLPGELLKEVDELHRSAEMVRRYEQSQRSPEQDRLLSDEKSREARHREKVADQLDRALANGTSYFRGVESAVGEYGEDLTSAVKGALAGICPKLYPKFDLVGVSVRGEDPRKVLEQEKLSSLPSVYHDGKDGLGVVKKEGGEFRVVTEHPALTAVLDLIEQRADYGEKATGNTLQSEFTAPEYGWDIEALMLLSATLLRAGLIEVYAGQRYTSYAEPGVRDVFRKINAFRAATFSPPSEEALTIVERTECAAVLEELYGEEVHPEEGAIAAKVGEHMLDEANRAQRIQSQLQANQLPGADDVAELANDLRQLTTGGARDRTKAFHGQRESIRDGVARLKALEEALAPQNLNTIRQAQEAVRRLWQELRDVDAEDDLAEEVEALKAYLATPEFYHHLADIGTRSDNIREKYRKHRQAEVHELENAVAQSVDQLRSRPEWEALAEESQKRVVERFERLQERVGRGSTSLSEIRSEKSALEPMLTEAIAELVRLTEESDGEEEREIEKIQVSRFGNRVLRTQQDVDAVVSALKEACLKAIKENKTVVLE